MNFHRPTRNHQLKRVANLSLIALATLLAGCDFPGRPKPANRPVRSDQVVDFDRLFQRNCAGCHGVDGTMGPAPPLNDAIFLAIIPDDELLRLIREGRPNTPMPAFAQDRGGPLTETQIKALAAGLKPRWKSKIEERLPLPPYRAESNVTTKEPTAGVAAFARACAGCHGEHGEGTSDAGPLNDRALLGLISDQALRRLIITGRSDLGMPNFAERDGRADDYQPLSSAEIDELVALLDGWRRGSPSASLEAATAANRLSADTEGRTP